MTNTERPAIIRDMCKGPNAACRKAHRAGRSVHIIPAWTETATLVLPTYHYATADEAQAAVDAAMLTAPTVRNDDDLYAYREVGVAHFIPRGFIDPSRR